MKYLIAGLGNIGAEYSNTRHNIGFKIADALAADLNGTFKVDRLASVCSVKYRARTLVIIKPTTYMNLSGKAVKYWLEKEKIAVENLLVVLDDIALPFGVLRLRPKGSDAGHNGLSHIIQTLGTNQFARLRFGVGNDFRKGYQVDYVLGEWPKEEEKELPFKINDAVEAIKSFTTIGLARTMNKFNTKQPL
jgi:PTH1 family peptidyl-tRNA hydrolase